MRKTNKKGFTIVELVIVIAVIAILAAVLIPTYSSLVKKANQSADIQAVREMNTALAVKQATDTMDITKVYEALEEAGMSAKDYHPLSTDTYFFWYSKDNRVLYVDGNDVVIYPDEYKGKNATKDFDSKLLSLTTEIKGEKYTSSKDVNGNVMITVNNGAQLYRAIQDLSQTNYAITLKGNGADAITSNFQHSINANTIITLTTDIDMQGASLSIGAVSKNVSLTIDGQGHTIRNVSNLDNGIDNATLNSEGKERNYYSGLIKYVDENASVTIKNITFENIVSGKSDVGSSGILVGNSKGNLCFEDVVIKDSTLYGKNKLGAFVGALYSDKQELVVKGEKTSLENVKIISTEGEAGILFGSTSNSGVNTNVKIDSKLFTNGTIGFVTNCSVVCESADTKTLATPEEKNSTLDGKAVMKADTKNAEEVEYRVTTAYIGFAAMTEAYSGTNSKFNPINTYDQAVAAGWIYDFSTSAAVTAN